jgi:hypothetical protein
MRSWCHASLRSSRRTCADIVTVPAFSFSAYRRRRRGVDGATAPAESVAAPPGGPVSASQLCCARKVGLLRARVRENTTVPALCVPSLWTSRRSRWRPCERLSDARGAQGDGQPKNDPPAWRPVGHSRDRSPGLSLTRAAGLASAVLLGGRSVPPWQSRASGRSRRGRHQGRRSLQWQVRWPRSRRTCRSQTIHRH